MLQALFMIDKDRIQSMIVEAEKIYDTDNMQEVYEDTLIRDIDTYLVKYCYLGEGEGLQPDGPGLYRRIFRYSLTENVITLSGKTAS